MSGSVTWLFPAGSRGVIDTLKGGEEAGRDGTTGVGGIVVVTSVLLKAL